MSEMPARQAQEATTGSRSRGAGDTQGRRAPARRLSGSHAAAEAALTLEAMRLGVVPSADLTAYTVGRDRELRVVDADLARAAREGGAVRAFLGDYGTGKTHLLELVRTRALAEGFLVGEATLDPLETAPSHPKRVYRSLVRSLRYPDRPHAEGLGLAPLLEAGCRSDRVADRFRTARMGRLPVADRLADGAHLYLTPALQYAARLAEPARRGASAGSGPWQRSGDGATARALLLDWLEGHPTIPNRHIDAGLSRALGRHDPIYSLLDYRPWARIYAYVLSGISTLAKAVGYSGLVILLDEAEFYSLLSAENRVFAQTLFRALTFAAVGRGEVVSGAALPFEEAALSGGGYGIQQSLPTVYDRNAGLYTVLAMTPNPDGLQVLHSAVPTDRVLEIGRLGRDDYIELARRVCGYYASARPDWDLPEAIVTPLGRVLTGLIGSGLVDNPRQAMKFIIDFLDVVRFHRDRVGQVVQSLSQQVLF